MRPPVTRWAFDNVFVRMAVVAIAWLTGVAVLSGVLLMPEAAAQVPDPTITVSPSYGSIWAEAFAPNDEVTISIDSAEIGTWPTDEWGNFDGNDYGLSFAVPVGAHVAVSDSTGTTKDHYVTNLAVNSVDEVANTVTGTADAGDLVGVWEHGSGHWMQVTADGSGVWTADFTGFVDFEPGTNGNSGETDIDGDQTYAFWNVPDPRFKARVDDNGFSGWDWTPNATVTVTIDGDLARTFNFGTDEWGNFDGNVDTDVAINQYIEATDGVSTKDMTVRSLVVTDVDVEADIVYGTTTAGDEIYVGIHSEDGNYRNVVADGSGNWTADFSTTWQDQGTYDIVLGTGGNAHYWEPDGDETQRTFRVSDPYITASVIHEEVWASDFPDEPDGQTLYYRLDDPGTPEIEYEGDMPLLVQDGWTEAGDRSFGRYDVQAGHVYTVRNRPFGEALGDGIERVLNISYVVVTGIDDVTDVITGTANLAEGPRLCVWSNDAELCSENPAFSWDTAGDGTWIADFGAVGSDVAPGHWNSVSQYEDDGDETHFWWNLPPWIVVELAEEDEAGNPLWPDVVRAEQWTGDNVTLEVNDSFVAEWINDGSWDYRFELPSIDLDPWDVVRVYDGNDDKTVTVEPLYIDNVNYYGDIPPNIVEGTADAYRNLRVNVNASVGGWWAERWVNADGTGYFVADFGEPGNGWREQWTADLGGAEGLGRHLFLETYDSDNDRVEARQCEGVPRIEIARSDGRVDAIDFPEGTTVTLEIDDPSNGVGVDYTDTGVAVRNPDNPCETIVQFDLGDFEVPDEATVVASDGTPEGTVTTVVIPFTIDAVDPETDTVSGQAPVGDQVWVQADGDNWRYVTAQDDGFGVGIWVADFSQQGTEPGEEQIVDLGPGSSGVAIMVDSSGNTTELSWRISAAQFQVSPSDEGIWGNAFEPNAPLTITVNGDDLPGGPYSADEWGNFGFGWDPADLDLLSGQVVVVSDGVTTKDHTVTDLVTTSVDPESDVVSGVAEPGSEVNVWEHQEDNNATVVACNNSSEYPCNGDAPGTWHADFSAVFDIQPGNNGNSGQCDDDQDCTQAHWQATPLPWVTGDSGTDQIWGSGDWSRDTPITITVDDPDTPTEPDFTTTVMMLPTEWDPSQYQFDVYVGSDIDLRPGVEIIAVGPSATRPGETYTKSLTLTTLAITAVDVEAETVSGPAQDGLDVYIDGGNDEETDWAFRLVSPVGGEFTADFGVPGSGDNEQATVDLRPGSRGTAQQYDEDGDYTHASWHVANPPWISTTWGGTLPGMTQVDLIQGWDWPEGEPIHIMVANVADPATPLFEWDMNVGQSMHADPPWWFEQRDDLGNSFELHLDNVFDLGPGHVITVSSADWEKSVEVVHVTIDLVDLENDVASGSAPEGTVVDVWAGFEDYWERSAYRVTGGEAAWSVNFAEAPVGDEWGNADLDLGWIISTDVWDEDGDTSVIDRYVPNPTFSVETMFNVWSSSDRWQHWPEGTPVEIVVDNDDDQGNGVKFTDSAVTESWGDAPWEIGFNTNVEPHEIHVGDVVYVTIGDITKVLHVEDISIEGVNEETDVVAGYAPPGSRVEVNVGNEHGNAHRSEDADDVTGYWQADFSQPGDEEHEQDTWDIVPGTDVSAQVYDEDGDSTHRGFNSDEPALPNFSVRMSDQQVHGYEWVEGEPVSLEINDLGNGPGVDYTASAWPEPAEWDPEQNFVWFGPFEDTGFEILSGFEVTMTQGDVTKSHTVTGLAVTEVNPSFDTVTGVATPFGWIDVHIHDTEVNRTVQADGSGVWLADFSVPGVEDWEQQTADIRLDTQGDASESDVDGDNTQIEWHVANPTFSVEAPFYVFSTGQDWELGDTVTVTIDDAAFPGPVETTVVVSEYDPTNNEWWVDLSETGFEIVPGHVVSVSDGSTTKTLTVADLVIDEVDGAGDTVSGQLLDALGNPLAGVPVEVNVDNEYGYAHRTAISDGIGNWVADFVQPGEGEGEEAQPFDILPNTGVSAQVYDDDWDSTHRGDCFECAGESFVQVYSTTAVPPITDLVIAQGFGPEVSLTIERGDETYSDWPDPFSEGGEAWVFVLYGEFDILPGDLVTVSDGMNTVQHEVTALAVTSITTDTHTIGGVARPNHQIQFNMVVNPLGEGAEAVIDLTVPTDSSGLWSVDLGAYVNFGLYGFAGSHGNIYDTDEGQPAQTTLDWWVEPTLQVTANACPVEGGVIGSLEGHGWILGETVDVIVTDETGGVVVEWSGEVAYDCSGEDCNSQGSWYLDAADLGVPVSPGMTITASQWLAFFPDDFGLSGWEKSIVVGSIAPEITSFAVPTEPMSIDVAVGAVGTFVDANQADGHAVTIDWGDGTGLETISEVSYEDTGDGVFEGTVNPSHLYLEPGVYRLTLSVSDDCGEVASLSHEYVVVYDPDGGFVTGGGWIESPEGAYAPDPTLTGTANFGFVSKYKKGAHVPTGNTEFQFHAGDLNFHSSEYDWLVVAGAKAMFKGTGTINRDGEYGFMISAIDAAKTPSTDVDLFRIKIWNTATDEVIYDNQMGDTDAATEIAAGNIVVHNGKKAK